MQIVNSRNARMKNKENICTTEEFEQPFIIKDVQKDNNEKTMEEVVNRVDLVMEFSWAYQQIKEIEYSLKLEINQSDIIQKSLNIKLKKVKKNYEIYLKELVYRGILPSEWKLI